MANFKPIEKEQELDVHNVLLKTGQNDVDDTYFIFIKSLNNPILRGKVVIGKDKELLDETFEALNDKENVFKFIESAYKEFTAQKLSKIYADEKAIRDEEKVKDTVEYIRKQEADMMAQAAAMEPEPEPEVPEEEPEETEEELEVLGHKDQLLNDKKSFTSFLEKKYK